MNERSSAVGSRLSGPLDPAAESRAPRTGDAAIEREVDRLVSALSNEERLSLLGGVNGFDVPGVERLGIPTLGTADGPFGVRGNGPGTYYPGGIGLAATWNVELARRIGAEIGSDMRAHGRHYHLGPGVNLYRSPLAGRNFEYFGEDPWLAARMAVAYVEGVQSRGVSSTVKHFVGNESEFARHTTDSRIGERALRELYLPPFEAAVKEARTGAVMSGYNLTNGTQMSANRRLGVDLLKEEWGFDGVLMSDWGGVHDAEGAANGGTDLEMPEPEHMSPRALAALLASGRLTLETVDDKVRRLLRNVVRFGWMDRAAVDPTIPKYRASARDAALQGAREGMVLLRNARPAHGDGESVLLPLNASRARSVAVIGPTGWPGVPLGNGSAALPTYHRVSFVEGIGARLGAAGEVHHHAGIPSIGNIVAATRFSVAPDGKRPGLRAERWQAHDVSGPPVESRVDVGVSVGTPLDMALLASGEALDAAALLGIDAKPWAMRWTGWFTPGIAGPHDVVVQLGGFSMAGYRLRVDGVVVADRWDANEAIMEACRVELDARPHEVVLEYHTTVGYGAPFLRMGIVRQDAWVSEAAVAMAARADVVVLAVGFDAGSEAENWDRTFALPPGQDELIDRVLAANANAVVVLTGGGGCDVTRWIDRAPAVLQAWYPGQEAGTALAELLFGDVCPSGRLPATFERRPEDNPTHAHYRPAPGSHHVDYAEGVFVGYRGCERAGTRPLFPFGHGLSYTTFAYANLAIEAADDDARWSVTFDVTNTGTRAGAAVAQVYVADREASVPRPPRELKGFAKPSLEPGETQRVTVPLDLRSLAFWDVERRAWTAEAGAFEVLVGESSSAIVLRGTFELSRTVTST